MGEREKERQRDYTFIQKHSRGLNLVPTRTYIFAWLNQLSYRCHQRDGETERGRERETETAERQREPESQTERERETERETEPEKNVENKLYFVPFISIFVFVRGEVEALKAGSQIIIEL